MKTTLKRYLSMLLAFLMMTSTTSIPVNAAPAPTSATHVVISQVYGGGGNSGAPYSNDFIELYNPTASAISLDGWSVQYTSSSGTFGSNTTPLTGSIAAESYYLIQENKGSGDYEALPTPDATGSISMSGSKGKVALVSNTDAATSKDDPDVVDFVGYGSANEYEGTGTAPTLSSTKSAMRSSSSIDTNDNAADFKESSPTPRNSTYGAAVTKCATPTANIPSGTILPGTQVTFDSTTDGVLVQYNMDSAASVNWTSGSTVNVTSSATYYVKAVKSGLSDSDVSSFDYTVDNSAPVTIAEAKAAAVDTKDIKIAGIVTYVSGKNVYVQDTTGAICLYLTSNASVLQKGDMITAIGTRDAYNNLLELSGINEATVLISSHDNTLPTPTTATISELIATPDGQTAGYNHMCEIVNVKGVTLTSISQLSQGGSDIVVYPKVDLTKYTGIAEGDTIDATLRMYDYRGTLEVEILTMSKSDVEAPLAVTASPNGGSIVSGDAVTLSANKTGAAIYYTLDGTNPTASSTVYTAPIAITGTVGETITLKAFAKASGIADSSVTTITYTIKDPDATLSIKEVLELPSGTKDVVVTGQIVYFATSYGNPVIQSVIDGKTYALYVYGSAPEGAVVGDIVKLTGTYSIYNGLPELSSVTDPTIIGNAAKQVPETVTIADLKTNGLNMLDHYVKIKDVSLGSYNANGSTEITDSTGKISIYKATAYPALVEANDVVDLYAMVACYHSSVQLYTGTASDNGYQVYDVVNDTKKPLLTLPEQFLTAKAKQPYTIAVEAADNKGIDTVTLTYTIGSNTVTAQPMTYQSDLGKYVFDIPAVELDGTVESLSFTITATDVTGLTTTSDAVVVDIDNRPQITAVTPAKNGNTGEDKTPTISATLVNAGTAPIVTLTLKLDNTTIVDETTMTQTADTSNIIYSYTPAALEDGNYFATVTVLRSDNVSNSETWQFTVGTPRFKAYFGQLHAHTAEYSDGSGTLQDSLNYLTGINDSDNVDFISLTDHSNYFDSTSAANPAGALNDKSLMTSESLSLWNKYTGTMRTFNENHAGALAALPGFEMTWSGGPGHINTFNSDGLVSRNNTTLNSKSGDAGMKAYYDTLIQDTDPLANLSQFNHPGATFGTFSDFAYWSPAYDQKMVAVEVGNGEGAIDSGGYFPSYSEYTKALDKGWHVAPTNNQDNHKGHWGNSNTARTVIITDDFSETGLLTGLKNMSVYATEDKNLNIDYKVNDLIMGSTISTVPTDPLAFTINIDDEDSNDTISKVEVITNGGRIAASKTFASNVANWSFELPPEQGYYYVRVTEADKNMAVTAPVWVGQAPLVGISSLETTSEMPVTGESLKLETTLFNNETSDVTVKSIDYTIDNTVIASETPNATITSMGTFKNEINYTPTDAALTAVTVSSVCSIAGQDKTFTANLDLNVRDSEKLVYIGIDASHFNEYVDGNYKASMGNFANMATDFDVRVVELETSDALIAAAQNEKYEMLILTPPTRRDGTAFLIGYKNYSDAEIDAVAAFAKSGKTVIVTGWGDYYENYTKYSDGTDFTLPANEQMSVQQNRLLKAIGSSLRISDDEIKDDVTNGGQPQRLYLTNYNLDNSFLNRVVTDEQVYSNYGGSTVYAVDSTNQPTSTYADHVSPMVYAFETSYSSDDDGDGTTGIKDVNVPKYDDKYMVAATETIAHEDGITSTVIVAGSAFMSNFEIQATLDSYSTPAYSNYTILENIVASVKDITPIATVQSADEGESFTIRGIVTSNASGYDQDTAFFDCIYVQDDTSGINAFPVSGNIQAGQTVEIIGRASSYNGERQIAVTKIMVVDDTVQTLPEPINATAAEIESAMYLGSLVRIDGTISNITAPNGAVESIYVRDAAGDTCRVFIDGYITSNKHIPNLSIGSDIQAVGLASIDTEGSRIRIRDRADIVCTDTSDDRSNRNNNTDTDTAPEPVKTETAGETATASATVEGKLEAPGRLKATISAAASNTLIEAAKNAEIQGQKAVIEIQMNASGDEKAMAVAIPKAAFKAIADDTKADVKINTGLGAVTFDIGAVKTISDASEDAAEDISISIEKVDASSVTESVRQVVGDRPVYDFTVSAGSKTVSSFGGGKATVNLPYTPSADEDVNAIVVYYLDDSGNLQKVRGQYNKETAAVEFVTTHFSTYIIGYDKKSFKDVSESDWYHDAVSYITARDIASGTGTNAFSPSDAITRGQFIVMMMKAYEIEPDTIITGNFADAGNTYYTGYLAAAKRLGITSGIGDNRFAPDAAITRQDLSTILYKTLVLTDELPEVDAAASSNAFKGYNDTAKVADYAEDAMRHFVAGGVLSGSYAQINPTTPTSRAEFVQILYNLLNQ
ncbi:CehA/McbA family metallohydrolase [Fusibacter paucivorans]|uniref:CehA/McbA family metallohydrolase n=1 Tax=Fusibacter paucivorans TaxID=76009 RepID=A0ABS5PNH0_9FIRM|nr:CehA/McbA family metallohydrolase [Fusibacter paucivorans]MBS7526467.1 CehA/McbA family metallohydrolase [Fusibacter paucivorans]